MHVNIYLRYMRFRALKVEITLPNGRKAKRGVRKPVDIRFGSTPREMQDVHETRDSIMQQYTREDHPNLYEHLEVLDNDHLKEFVDAYEPLRNAIVHLQTIGNYKKIS